MILPHFSQTTPQELEHIALYDYMYLKRYTNEPKNTKKRDWYRSNSQGEMYEHLIYEKLLQWALDTDEVSDFLLKGPYVSEKNKVEYGFQYDSKRRIYYMSDGETIGEFDALFKYDNRWCFVEMSNTQYESSIMSLKHGIRRKHKLLKLLFPENEVVCWIVTTFTGQISTEDLSNTEVIRTSKYKLEPDSLGNGHNDGSLPHPDAEKCKTIDQLSYQTFNYFEILQDIHKHIDGVKSDTTNPDLLKIVRPYIGLVERIFLGKLPIAALNKTLRQLDFKPINKRAKVKDVYLALKIEDDESISKRVYLRGNKGHYYKLEDFSSARMIRIPNRKRTTKDIKHLDKSLKTLEQEQVRSFFVITNNP